jgi:Leucine-rich repeat (LRR) protein
MRLILPLDINLKMYSPFESLKILSLRNTRISCQDIRALSPLLVNLEELSVGCNKWTDVDIVSEDQQSFRNLKLIHLESNEIESWEKIEKLSNLPR